MWSHVKYGDNACIIEARGDEDLLQGFRTVVPPQDYEPAAESFMRQLMYLCVYYFERDEAWKKNITTN